MSEQLTSQWGWNNCGENMEEGCGKEMGFGYGGCNTCFFETLLMLIIIIWLLRWLFTCNCGGFFGAGC